MKSLLLKKTFESTTKIAALASFTFFSPLTFADLNMTFQQLGQRMGMYTLDCAHWYVGGNIGVSHLHDKPTVNTNNYVHENGPGWNVNGGYQFNSLIGAELGYTQYHKSRELSSSSFGVLSIADTEHYGAYLAAVGHLPLFYKFSILGKLGYGYSYANKTYNPGTQSSSGSVSLYYGLGFAYSVTHTVDFIGQWASSRGNHLTGSAELYSLGVQFNIV